MPCAHVLISYEQCIMTDLSNPITKLCYFLFRELTMTTSILSSRKLVFFSCFLMFGLALVFLTVHMQSKNTTIVHMHAKPVDLNEDTLQDKDQTSIDKVHISKLKDQNIPLQTAADNSVKHPQRNEVHRKDEVDNSGAISEYCFSFPAFIQ